MAPLRYGRISIFGNCVTSVTAAVQHRDDPDPAGFNAFEDAMSVARIGEAVRNVALGQASAASNCAAVDRERDAVRLDNITR